MIPEWVQLLLPQQLLGFQVLFLLVELAAHGPHFLELQIQGLLLLVLTDFPEVPFPSLVNDSEHTGDGSTNNSDLGKFGSLGQLGQPYLRVSSCSRSSFLLRRPQVFSWPRLYSLPLLPSQRESLQHPS